MAILDKLIARWEASMLDGEELSARDLTLDCPDMFEPLEREISELKDADAFAARLLGASQSLRKAKEENGEGSESLAMFTPEQYGLPAVINGKYELCLPLGIGHFGMVWQAQDLVLEREVAIKFPSERFLNKPAKLEEFNREARLLADVSKRSPYVVDIYELGEVAVVRMGEEAVLPYIVMEKMDDTLANHTHDWLDAPLAAARIVSHLAEALHAAHVCDSGPLIHRDIKPNNIFIKRIDHSTLANNLEVKLGDFGLAFNSDDCATDDYKLYGSLDYIAPEIFKGDTGDVRGDIYALGVILYILLTGRAPFSGGSDTIDCLEKIIRGDSQPPATHNPELNHHPQLAQICARAMSANPNDRFDNAAQFASALRLVFEAPSPTSDRVLKKNTALWFVVVAAAGVLLFAYWLLNVFNENIIIPDESSSASLPVISLPVTIPQEQPSLELSSELKELKKEMASLNARLKTQPPEEATKSMPPEKPVADIIFVASEPARQIPQGSEAKSKPQPQSFTLSEVPSVTQFEVAPQPDTRPLLPDHGVEKEASTNDFLDFAARAYLGKTIPKQSTGLILKYLETPNAFSRRAGLSALQEILKESTPPANDIALAFPHIIKIYHRDGGESAVLVQQCLALIQGKYRPTEKQQAQINEIVGVKKISPDNSEIYMEHRL